MTANTHLKQYIYIYVFWVESANLSAFLKHPFEDNRFLSPDK